MQWSDFFPGGTRVVALPSWRSPRLYIPTGSVAQRWKRSAFYPAFRTSAKVFRTGVRAAVAIAPVSKKANERSWMFGDFVAEALPGVESASLLMGTEGPAQKATLQLLDSADNVVGYVKYGESDSAISGLRNEAAMLGQVPEGIGPECLKEGSLGNGYGILTTSIAGNPVAASLPPPAEALSFQQSLITQDVSSVENHPGLDFLRSGFEQWIKELGAREWPVAIQHGDFAPWNLRDVGGSLRAFDWEYGRMRGFPYLDLAFFSLQTDVKMYHSEPSTAFKRAEALLKNVPEVGVQYASVLVRAAAFDAYAKGLSDGHQPDAFLQSWYRSVWEVST